MAHVVSIDFCITLYQTFLWINVSSYIDSPSDRCILVLPYMASLVAKKKGKQLYYYVVESARVDGKPRIVHQAYLGTADKVAALVKDRTSPVPLSAASRDFGLPGALWLAAEQTGLFGVLEVLWPAPDPALLRPATSCWRPSTASVNRGPRPR